MGATPNVNCGASSISLLNNRSRFSPARGDDVPPTLSLFLAFKQLEQMRTSMSVRRACVQMSVSNANLPLLSLLLSLLAITAELDSESLFRAALAIRRERDRLLCVLPPSDTRSEGCALLSRFPPIRDKRDPGPTWRQQQEAVELLVRSTGFSVNGKLVSGREMVKLQFLGARRLGSAAGVPLEGMHGVEVAVDCHPGALRELAKAFRVSIVCRAYHTGSCAHLPAAVSSGSSGSQCVCFGGLCHATPGYR